MVLHSLHRLLVDQGRDAEAAGYERELQARREQDPYYWVGLGFRHLGAGETRLAIRALERARGLSNGFAEVHRYLAVAYWRAGEQARANEQLAMLASIDGGTGGSSTLKKKLRAAQP